MNGWMMFWGLLLAIVLLVFAGLTVVVAIGGLFDIRALFRTIDAQHREAQEEEVP